MTNKNKRISKGKYLAEWHDNTKIAFHSGCGIRLTDKNVCGAKSYYLSNDDLEGGTDFYELTASTAYDLMVYYHEAIINNVYDHFLDEVSNVILDIIDVEEAPEKPAIKLEDLFDIEEDSTRSKLEKLFDINPTTKLVNLENLF